jgi:hypothetical protein
VKHARFGMRIEEAVTDPAKVLPDQAAHLTWLCA